jgi:hypothetical protein
MIAFDGVTVMLALGLGGVVGAAALFGLGFRIGRSRSLAAQADRLNQYALDYGSVGQKRARATRMVAQRDWLFEIFETDYLDFGKWPTRHVMRVPVQMSFVGYGVGLPLSAVESAKVEAGDWGYFESLAQQVQGHPSRFRSVHIDTSALDAGKSS